MEAEISEKVKVSKILSSKKGEDLTFDEILFICQVYDADKDYLEYDYNRYRAMKYSSEFYHPTPEAFIEESKDLSSNHLLNEKPYNFK